MTSLFSLLQWVHRSIARCGVCKSCCERLLNYFFAFGVTLFYFLNERGTFCYCMLEGVAMLYNLHTVAIMPIGQHLATQAP